MLSAARIPTRSAGMPADLRVLIVALLRMQARLSCSASAYDKGGNESHIPDTMYLLSNPLTRKATGIARSTQGTFALLSRKLPGDGARSIDEDRGRPDPRVAHDSSCWCLCRRLDSSRPGPVSEHCDRQWMQGIIRYQVDQRTLLPSMLAMSS